MEFCEEQKFSGQILGMNRAAVMISPIGSHHCIACMSLFLPVGSFSELSSNPSSLGCVFWTEDKIWTSVQHNNTELTHVQGASPEKPYSMALDYGGSLGQLEAVIDSSEHCEQEVAYYCRRSRLLNTPGKLTGPPTLIGHAM